MSKISYPPYVQWELTNRCNHNCIHCYNYWRTNHEEKFEDCEQIDIILNKIIENKPAKVVLTGGEPTLLFEKLKKIVTELRKNNIEISINTNATKITMEMANFFARNNVGFLISFPSSDKKVFQKIVGVDSFNQVVDSIKLLQKYGIHFSTNTVISRLNVETVYDTFKFLNSLGVSSCQMALAGTPINASEKFRKYALSKEDWKKIANQAIRYCKEFNQKVNITDCIPHCIYESLDEYRLLKSRICSAGLTSYAITINGDVKACPRGDEVYGNIIHESLPIIYERMASWRNDTYIPNECRGCNHRLICRGGCRMIGYSTSKKYNTFLSFANKMNIPIKYNESIKNIYRDSDKFFINKNAIFMKEKNCVRVQVGSKCLFISDEFAEYLQRQTAFTKKELINACENSTNINYVLNILVDNYIIKMA